MLGQKKQDEEKEGSESRGSALERFSQKLGGDGDAVSIVGKGMQVVGDVTGRGGLRIEGQVEGTVTTDGNVVVVEGGEVDGDLTASEVVVAGKVTGTIEAEKAARFKSGCQVDAEVRSSAVEVEEGAVVNGRIDMTSGGRSGASTSKSSDRSGASRKGGDAKKSGRPADGGSGGGGTSGEATSGKKAGASAGDSGGGKSGG